MPENQGAGGLFGFGAPAELGVGGGLLGFAGGLLQGYAQKAAATKARRRQRKAISGARTFADERIAELTGEGSLFAQGVDFLRSTFGDAANTPLAQDYVKQIRAAQASRGTLFGGAAVNTEASGLAAFSQDLRARLLPQLQSFSFAPEQLRQSIVGFEVPLRIASRTGAQLPGIGPNPLAVNPFVGALNQGLAGFLGGAQIGLNVPKPLSSSASGGGGAGVNAAALGAIDVFTPQYSPFAQDYDNAAVLKW